MRYTEYHTGVAVIKDKTLLKEAMAKLAKLEDAEEQGRLNVYPEGLPLSPILEEKYTKGEKKNEQYIKPHRIAKYKATETYKEI